MKYAVLLLTLTLGCSAPKRGINYSVDPSCLTAPIRLENCDQASPPHCKKQVTTMKPRCEQIDLKPISSIDKEHSMVALVSCDNYLLGGAQIYQPGKMQRCPART